MTAPTERQPERRKREPTFQESALVASMQKLEKERDELVALVREGLGVPHQESVENCPDRSGRSQLF